MEIDILIAKGVESLKNYGHVSLPNSLSGFAARQYNGEDLSAGSQSTIICSLYESGYLDTNEIENYLLELKKMQIVSGVNFHSWCNEERSSVWATSKSIIAFLTLSPNSIQEQFLMSSIDWLLQQRNSDGGWGYKKGSYSRPYYTYYVMMAEILAYNSTSDIKLKNELKDSLDKDIAFLQFLHFVGGKWKSANKENICPASTLMALCAMKKYDELFNTVYFDITNFNEGISFVRNFIIEMQNIVWKEDNLNWELEFFLPGKMDLILQLFDISDNVTQRLKQYLVNSYVVNDNEFGWALNNKKMIYTWTTGLAIKSLSIYLKNLKKQEIMKIENIENDNKNKLEDKYSKLREQYNKILVIVTSLVIFNGIYFIFLPNYKKIYDFLLSLGINFNVIFSAIIVGLILVIIDEFTKKWFRKLLTYLQTKN